MPHSTADTGATANLKTIINCLDIIKELSKEQQVTISAPDTKLNKALAVLRKSSHYFLEIERLKALLPIFDNIFLTVSLKACIIQFEKAFIDNCNLGSARLGVSAFLARRGLAGLRNTSTD